MSSISSTSTLASWDPKELFQLVNPDKMALTCVGYAPSCRRRCRNAIAFHNIQAAKEVVRQIVRPGVSITDLKEMLFDLAGYTVCRRCHHQDQATYVSDRWFGMVQTYRDDDEDRGSDTSDDDDGDSDDGTSTTSSSSDGTSDDDYEGVPRGRATDNARELRRRFDELETLQREFEELFQRQRQSLQDRVSRPTVIARTRQSQETQQPDSEISRQGTVHGRRAHEEALPSAEQALQEADYLTAQRAREDAREQHRRDRGKQAKREEAQRQAQRQAEEKAKAEAEAETKRLRKEEQEAEKVRLDRDRQAKAKAQQQQSGISSWEKAWLRYESAWASLTLNSTGFSTPIDTDIRTSQIWPTKSGSFASCCEEDVRAFFRCQPGDVNRRILRRQALRWHPDRAARLFGSMADEVAVGEVLRTVTMISQVVIGILGVAAR